MLYDFSAKVSTWLVHQPTDEYILTLKKHEWERNSFS